MPHPASAKGRRVSHPPVPSRAPGVLRPPAAQPDPCLRTTHSRDIALCELFLGCEPHFRLWKKLFCLVPRTQGESLCQVGGAEVWCIAETGYLSGTPKKAPENWPSEWFYIDDVPLLDPVRTGLPKFSNAPPRARLSWRPRGPQEEDTREIHFLMSRIKLLAKSGLTIVEVMAICIMRGVQPLQYRGKPMWHFNGEDDAARCGHKGPDSATALEGYCPIYTKGKRKNSFALNRRTDSPCTTP